MIYEPSVMAVSIFVLFVLITLGLSLYLGRRTRSSAGYFAAHGQIPWWVNGIAFAGDYLSAASFLGICGMIAFYGYDGFLYSIGFLAGWIVALFVIAEPMKRLGKYTFADALNAKFQSRGIQLAAGISTLIVSLFYLIPQMVGAGALVRPLLGLPHWAGVLIVGAVVIFIVVTAGMVSTTWVQFFKGSLLVFFTAVMAVLILARGLRTSTGGVDGYQFVHVTGPAESTPEAILQAAGFVNPALPADDSPWQQAANQYVMATSPQGHSMVFRVERSDDMIELRECQTLQHRDDGSVWVNGRPLGEKNPDGSINQLHPIGHIVRLAQDHSTGPLGPIAYLREIGDSDLLLWRSEKIPTAAGPTTVFYPRLTRGSEVLSPGEHPKFAGIRQPGLTSKLNFISLMFALFCGTASLPHILIRYYTVRSAVAARKSTIVGIAAIGFFYILTLYLGLGAMTSGALDPTDTNMAAPLLARSLNEWLFAIISAIAFTTVLGTVSGLILASAGAVAHDVAGYFLAMGLGEAEQVRLAKVASVIVGAVAIVLGVLFENMNVGYLVGWAFSIAASANLPALVMLLFWKRTTYQGIMAGVLVGMISSLGWILLSADTFSSVYHAPRPQWLEVVVPFSQPGIVTIPLSFVALIVVSLATARPQPLLAAGR
ncbi:MAG: cation acetate symporter [Pirellulaceae bacterium]|nr:MAG: cation acetate symporter [Pirellulaceae bacterium]